MKILLVIFLILAYLPLKAIELNSTVMLFNQDDIDKCEPQIQKAHGLKNSNIHFVSSIYLELEKRKVKEYFLKDKQANPKEITTENIEKYQKGFLRCVGYALDKFQRVYTTIVINEVREDRLWRNFYDYDPLAKYPKFSLYDIAFSAFNKLKTKNLDRLYLSLTGEMGRTVKLYPQSYSKILKLLPEKLNVGISLNYNQSFGSFFDFSLKLPVLNEFDFIGFSGYGPMPSNCDPDDFEENIHAFRKRMRSFGLTKPDKEVRFHINETGIGGGMPFAFLISKLAFKGVYGKYSPEKDPWRHKNYRRIRKNFYHCLLTTLKKTDLIEAAFIWNADSLDIQGLYPFSKEYRDEEISKLIKIHNLNHIQ